MQEARINQVMGRAQVWTALFLLLFAALAVRLFAIQILRHDYYVRKAEATRGRQWPINAPRGNIYDRNGRPLALNLKLYAVAADPGLIDDPTATAGNLAALLRTSPTDLEARLRGKPGSRYVLLCDSVDEQVAEAIRQLGHPGIIVSTEWKRVYPHGDLAGAVLGFVGADRHGLSGIEAALNVPLTGDQGERLVVLDGRLPRSRRQIPGRTVVSKEMVPGSSITLTIDQEIQAIAEEELAAAVESANAAGGCAVVMDPRSGQVLALATQPGFDPNEYQSYDPTTWVNQAVSSPNEPGSTFKAVTACIAIEEGVMANGEIHQCTGTRPIGRRSISCALHGGTRAHGPVDLDKMVVVSCNTGMSTVALALGEERLYRGAKRLGFGEKTGIELAGESSGILPRPGNWSQARVANVGFGQGISVTPVQLLSAYCIVANGGSRVHPRLVQSIVHPDGTIEQCRPPAAEKVLSPETCARVAKDLERVVEEGTGKTARLRGWRAAGKTGTAQKPTPEMGFRSGKYLGSFIGFAPSREPRLAVLVSIDEPKGVHYGGVVAAPAFRNICERSLSYLRVPPDETPAARAAAGRGA